MAPGSSSALRPQGCLLESTWEGGKLLNIYVLDYLKKRGYHKTVTQLVAEAHIPTGAKPPIHAQQGLLFEWWTVFWIIFAAKNRGSGPEEAFLYNKYQDQSRSYAQRAGLGSYPNNPRSLVRYPSVPGTTPSPTGHQQRRSNGVSQYHSPTLVPSPQSQGGPQRPLASPMGPLGPSPHMNWAAFPPPIDRQHSQGPGSVGSTHSTPIPANQKLMRPPSNNNTSSQNHRNMSGRHSPSPKRFNMDEGYGSPDTELTSFSSDVVSEAQVRAGFCDVEAQSLIAGGKPATRVKQGGPSNNGVGPPGTNTHGPLQNSGTFAQPMQQQSSMQPQRRTKRINTADEEHETLPKNDQYPNRKRLRRTSNPGEQQLQSRVVPIGLHPPGSLRGPVSIDGLQPPLSGFGGTQMHSIGIARMTPMHAMSPHGPPLGLMDFQTQSQLYAQQYPQEMTNAHKNPAVPVSPVGPADPQFHLLGPGGRLTGHLSSQQLPQPSQSPNGMVGSVLPPGRAGTNALPKPSDKEGEGDTNPGDLRTLGAPINNALLMNTRRPLTAASAAVPTRAPPTHVLSMPDLRFCVSETFANGDRDFAVC